MTPIQKAKEIIEGFLDYFESNQSPNPIYEWLATPKAAALLSGEDWISVKDRLPDGLGDVLVFSKTGAIYFDSCCSPKKNEPFGWNRSSQGKITHWMPLPEPPKP